MKHIYSDRIAQGETFQIRDNWQGKGYRLYIGDYRFVTQIDGEINGKVYSTIKGAKQDCEKRFGITPIRVRY